MRGRWLKLCEWTSLCDTTLLAELPLGENEGARTDRLLAEILAGRLHGFGFIHEAVLQLRGEAGDRQVGGPAAPGRLPEVAAVANGGGPIAGAMILTKEDGR